MSKRLPDTNALVVQVKAEAARLDELQKAAAKLASAPVSETKVAAAMHMLAGNLKLAANKSAITYDDLKTFIETLGKSNA